MNTRLRHLAELVLTSYWFVPGVMAAAGTGAALGMLFIDRILLQDISGYNWIYTGGAEGARTLLGAIAGSVITVAGVVFSITIAALTQASSQFGPRLLRNFMRDTGNQVVLGTFVGIFVYCLLVLRSIRGEDSGEFIPHAATSVGVLLAVASIAVLIYFIHHVSMSLQAPMIVAAVAGDLARVIGALEPAQEDAAEPADPPQPPDEQSGTIGAPHDGYVQAIAYASLVDQARSRDLLLRLECRPGDYVIEGNPVLRVWPAQRLDVPQVSDDLQKQIILGRRRTPEQDLEYAIRQLVEVAVRSFSTGINDPFTAINCIDALGASLCRLARYRLPPGSYRDERGALRLIARTYTFVGLVDASFNQIRQYGRESVAVMIRLLEIITACAGQITAPHRRQALGRHVEMIYQDAMTAIPQDQDRQDIEHRYRQALAALV